MRTYIIGRSPSADIVLADPSVGRRHAELLVAADGRLFLTDCGSDNGSWLAAGDPKAKSWTPLRQQFITANQSLRLGEYHCSAEQLLAMNATETRIDHNAADATGPRNDPPSMPHGAVERDPHTGEIIRRRP